MLFAFSNTFCSVAKSYLTLCNPHGMQHTRLPCPSLLSPGVCSNSCPLSWWYYLIISSSAAPFIFCLQSLPALGFFFPMNQLVTTGSQSTEASPSASVLPVSIQGWFPLGLTGFDLLLSKVIGTGWSTVTVIVTIVHKITLSLYFFFNT